MDKNAVYEEARSILSLRRREVEADLQKRRERIYSEVPEIKKLEENIRSTYLKLLKVIASRDPNAKQAAERIRDDNLASQELIRQLLVNATGDPDYLKAHYFCPKCNDTGFVDGIRCSCFNDLLQKVAASHANEACTIMLHDFSEFRNNIYPEGEIREYMTKIRNYLFKYSRTFANAEDKKSLLFCGRTGLGKTFLSSCVAKEVGKAGLNVAFSSVTDFLKQIEKEHFHGDGGEKTLDTLIDADLLIIDDLGSEFFTTFSESVFYTIINSRINLNRPMIISTNMLTKEITARYNERIVSRLFGCFKPIMFRGEDIHQKLL